MTFVVETKCSKLLIYRDRDSLLLQVARPADSVYVAAYLDLDTARELRSFLRIKHLVEDKELDDGRGQVIVLDRRNMRRVLDLVVEGVRVRIGWKDSKRLVEYLDSLELHTPVQRAPIVLKEDVREAAAGELPPDPREEEEVAEAEQLIDEGPKAKAKKADDDWDRLKSKRSKPKPKQKEVKKVATTKIKKLDDKSVRSGGKVLQGVKLKNGSELIERRSGTTVQFKGFTPDGRVKIKGPEDKKARELSRASLAANYVPA